MPPRISLRSILATVASLVIPAHSRSKNGVASLAYVAGIHDFTVRANPKTWMAATSPAMTGGRRLPACSLKPICYTLAQSYRARHSHRPRKT
jgi:hypothetical protein